MNVTLMPVALTLSEATTVPAMLDIPAMDSTAQVIKDEMM